ncbi:VOC family protein [Mucisphaera sp.]|uniref:VOC family protein n=1 Tax=Mucisphaera sp. TaxID=2913024 RepID=UPI003D0B4C43
MPEHTNPTISNCGFHHVAIFARDFDKAVDFYTGLLGMSLRITWQDAPNRAAMLDTGDGNYIELFEKTDKPQPAEPTKDAWFHIALRCANLDDVIQKVRNAGFPITMEPRSLNIEATNTDESVPIRIAFFTGPEGESIELFQNETL